MRKTAATITLAALLITAAAGFLFGSAGANPYYEGFFPLEPATTQPSIVVESPVQNLGYDSGDVWLNFTITKPETWFVRNVAYTEDNKSMTLAIGRITRVYYVLDDGEPQNITVNDGELPSDFPIDVFPTRIFNFSARLALTGGMRSVKVGFEADTYYYTGWGVSEPGLRSVEVDGFSEEVNFTIAGPLKTAMVAAASAAVAVVTVVGVAACAGLLLYFKKRKRKAFRSCV
jgi:hypothetical protein